VVNGGGLRPPGIRAGAKVSWPMEETATAKATTLRGRIAFGRCGHASTLHLNFTYSCIGSRSGVPFE